MYHGIIAPLVTPLKASGDVCASSVGKLIDSVRHEITAVMPALSTGEGWLLDRRQWVDMVAASVAHAAGMPVLAGVQLPTTAEVAERAKVAADHGVNAIVVTTPFQKNLSQDEIFRHFAVLHEQTDLPLFLYNEHAISGNEIALETIVRICALPGVVGIKESSGSPELTRAITAAVPHVPVFEGWENLLLQAQGIAGFIGPLANLEPGLCSRMLSEPSVQLQDEINAVCERLGLFKPDWYRWTKTELVAREVIETDRIVMGTVEK